MNRQSSHMIIGGLTVLALACWSAGFVVAGVTAAADQVWSGTWKRTEPVPGGGALTLTLKGGDTGTITLVGSSCLRADTPATVTTTGSNLRVEIKDAGLDGRGATAVFTATVSGKKLSGAMTVTCSAGKGVGTWQAMKE